jgi:uncharacterized Tic20 family protein
MKCRLLLCLPLNPIVVSSISKPEKNSICSLVIIVISRLCCTNSRLYRYPFESGWWGNGKADS